MTNAGIKIPLDNPRGLFINTPGDYGQALGKIDGAIKTKSKAAPNGKGPCK